MKMLSVIYNDRNKYCLSVPFKILRHCSVYCYKEERKEQVNSRYIKILNVYIGTV